ncbi:MAG: alpha/beta hydrolase [Chloroflexi bacterium]|nr:alpha/beta hydrolase [Chloroflexota bacterium]
MASGIQATEHYAALKDGRVYYQKVGQGPPLVFIHGVGGSGWTWRKVVPTFVRHFACYVFDLPGYDHSDIPPRKYTLEDFTGAVAATLDAAGVNRASFVGHHMGSLIALNLAARLPQRVSKLVFDGCPAWTPEQGRLIFERFFLPQYDEKGLPVITPVEEALRRDPKADREALERSNQIRQRSGIWLKWSAEAVTSFNVPSIMPLVKTPTLIMFEEGDGLRRGEQRLLEGIKGASVKIIPGQGGAAHSAAPEEFARQALDFLLAAS